MVVRQSARRLEHRTSCARIYMSKSTAKPYSDVVCRRTATYARTCADSFLAGFPLRRALLCRGSRWTSRARLIWLGGLLSWSHPGRAAVGGVCPCCPDRPSLTPHRFSSRSVYLKATFGVFLCCSSTTTTHLAFDPLCHARLRPFPRRARPSARGRLARCELAVPGRPRWPTGRVRHRHRLQDPGHVARRRQGVCARGPDTGDHPWG